MERYRQGDKPAGDELFAWAHGVAGREIARTCRSRRDDAEELLAQVDEKLVRAIKTGQIVAKSDGEIAAWVITTSQRVAIDSLRRKRRSVKEKLPGNLPHPDPGPGQQAEARQRFQRLEAELAGWQPKDRYVLLAKEDGVPALEIARSLEMLYGERVSPKTVDSRCSKLRARLSAKLKESS
jgi:DNA-directed RNA polymerase specialized sigma24 family protein